MYAFPFGKTPMPKFRCKTTVITHTAGVDKPSFTLTETTPTLRKGKNMSYSNHLFAVTAAVSLAASGTLWAAETEYSGTWCGSGKRTVLESNPDVTVAVTDQFGIQTPNSTFKPFENSTTHCMGYARSMQGKLTQKGACRWTDASGDTFTGEFETIPDKLPVWTFLAGTGKWKGIKGGGTFRVVTAAKPAEAGTFQLCMEHSGKYELP